MELRVLGCHGGETPKHRTSSFLVDGRLAIDAGAITSMLTLDEQKAVEVVLVSHAHMDHVRDLATLADNRCQQGGPPLVVAGIPSTLNALKKHFFNDELWPDFSKIPAGKSGMTVVYEPLKPERVTRICGLDVRPVLVSHTIDTAGFIVSSSKGAMAYSGDTGPTERFWEVLAETENLKAVLVEVSFPNEEHVIAKVSAHHTPETLGRELKKLTAHRDVPVMLYHIKPFFQAKVERELARIKARNLTILRLGDQFLL